MSIFDFNKIKMKHMKVIRFQIKKNAYIEVHIYLCMDSLIAGEMTALHDWFQVMSGYQMEFSKGLVYAASKLGNTSYSPALAVLQEKTKVWSALSLQCSQMLEEQEIKLKAQLEEFKQKTQSIVQQGKKDNGVIASANDGEERVMMQRPHHLLLQRGIRNRSARICWLEKQAQSSRSRMHQKNQNRQLKSLERCWYYGFDGNEAGLSDYIMSFLQIYQTDYLERVEDQVFLSLEDRNNSNLDFYEEDNKTFDDDDDDDENDIELEFYDEILQVPLRHVVFGVRLKDIMDIPSYTTSCAASNSARIPAILFHLTREIEYRMTIAADAAATTSVKDNNIEISDLYDQVLLMQRCDPADLEWLREQVESVENVQDLGDLVFAEETKRTTKEQLAALLLEFLDQLQDPIISPLELDRLENDHNLGDFMSDRLLAEHGHRAVLEHVIGHCRSLASFGINYDATFDRLLFHLVPSLTGLEIRNGTKHVFRHKVILDLAKRS